MITEYPGWIHWAPGRRLAMRPDERKICVGQGLRGYVEACVQGFAAGHDVSFIRSHAKSYGLKAEQEGAHRRLSAGSDTPPVQMLFDGESIGVSKCDDVPEPEMFASHPFTPDLTAWGDAAHSLHEALMCVQRHIRIASGAFVLSSGKSATGYVDTIPAITSFESLEAVHAVMQSLVRRPRMIIAPPYGAVSLALFIGMKWQVDVGIPLRNDVAATELVRMLNAPLRGMPTQGSESPRPCGASDSVLIVDDYYSTGSTIQRVLPMLRVPTEIFSICRRGDARDIPDHVTSLFVNEGGGVVWSEEMRLLEQGGRDVCTVSRQATGFGTGAVLAGGIQPRFHG